MWDGWERRRAGVGWTHDVIVVGAGAAGLTAAGGCARLGLRVALVERDRMGGECLNTGCVPSKALLAAAHRAQAMRGSGLGVTGPGPTIDFAAVRAHVQGAIAAIAPHDSAARFAAWGVEVIAGEASLTGRHSLDVGDRRLSAPRIVLATGSDPAVPAIPGLADTPFLTNETLFALDTLPSHLVVLGAGSVGVEMAQAFRRLGSAVTLLDSGAVLAMADAAAAGLLRGVLEAEGVSILDHAGVTAVAAEAGGIRLDRAGGPPVRGSHLLVAVGRRARLEGLGLDKAGVATGAGRHRRRPAPPNDQQGHLRHRGLPRRPPFHPRRRVRGLAGGRGDRLWPAEPGAVRPAARRHLHRARTCPTRHDRTAGPRPVQARPDVMREPVGQ